MRRVNWAEDEIRQLVGIGAITGYPDGTYRPENTITRAEFSSVMWGALGLHEAEGAMFPDTDGHWGQGRIEALIQDGIIDTELYAQHYSPDEPVVPENININTASLEGLQEIVHIGESRAQEIIELRPFYSLDELTRVTGIGDARLEDIKDEGKAYVE